MLHSMENQSELSVDELIAEIQPFVAHGESHRSASKYFPAAHGMEDGQASSDNLNDVHRRRLELNAVARTLPSAWGSVAMSVDDQRKRMDSTFSSPPNEQPQGQ